MECKVEEKSSSRIDQIESDISDLKNLVKGILLRLDDAINWNQPKSVTDTSSSTQSSSTTVINNNHTSSIVTSHPNYHDFMTSSTAADSGGDDVIKPTASTSSQHRSGNYVLLIKTQLEKEIASIQNQKSEVMESLRHDEQQGEEFSEKLKTLKSSLERYQQQQQQSYQQYPSSQFTASSKHDEDGKMKIVQEMKLLEEDKEKHLGTNIDMNLKKEERLLQVRHHKNNLADLQSSLSLLMETFESTLATKTAESSSLPRENQAAEADFGICIQHNIYNIGSSSFTDVSTQTSAPLTTQYTDDDCDDVIQVLTDDGVNNTPPPEAAESRLHGVTLLSRVTQTKVSSFGPPSQQAEDNNNNNVKQEVATMTSSPKSADGSATKSSSSSEKEQMNGLFPQLETREQRNVMSLAMNLLSCCSASSLTSLLSDDAIPILVQLLYGDDVILPHDVTTLPTPTSVEIWATTRRRAFETIVNIIKAGKGDEGKRNMELRTINLFNEIRLYGESMLRAAVQTKQPPQQQAEAAQKVDRVASVLRAICHMLFNPAYVELIGDLGGLACLAQVIVISNCVQKQQQQQQQNNNLQNLLLQTLLQILTGLNSSQQTDRLLRMNGFLEMLQRELDSGSDKNKQIMITVLCSLCERAEERGVLQNNKLLIGHVMELATQFAQDQRCRSVDVQMLKTSLLTILHLSSYSPENRVHICQYHGSLRFLVSLLSFPTATTKGGGTDRIDICEIGCGILRNLSFVITVNENYCEILRGQHVMKTLLRHLRSTTIGSHATNICAIICNLSARSDIDRGHLRALGGFAVLRDLAQNSKHRPIQFACSRALQVLNPATSSSTVTSSGMKKNNHDTNKIAAQQQQQQVTPKNGVGFPVVPTNNNNTIPRPQPRTFPTNKPTTTQQQQAHNNFTSPTVVTATTQMPDNLLQKLRDIDVCGGQDDVVDFSKKFSDQTQVQVAKDEVTTVVATKPWSPPPSSGKPQQQAKNSVDQRLHYLEENFQPTEMPTNFGALYNEVGPSSNPAPTQQVVQQSSYRPVAPSHHHNDHDPRPPHHHNDHDPRPPPAHEKSDSGAATPAYNYRLPSSTSGRRSGTRTPHTPMYQETPLVYSRTSPVSSLEAEIEGAIGFESDVTSNPLSHTSSPSVSPSDLPDSPFEPMPPPKQPPPEGNKEQVVKVTSSTIGHVMTIAMDEGARDEIITTATGGGGDVSAAMSVVTSLSSLTIGDGGRVQVLGKSGVEQPPGGGSKQLMMAVVTCNDELRVFTSEGNLSPLSGLSVISDLVEEEEKVHDRFVHKFHVITPAVTSSAHVVVTTSSQTSTSTVVASCDVIDEVAVVADDDSDDSSLSFSDLDQDQGLLEEAIKCGFPRKSSHNRSSKQPKNKTTTATTENKTATTTEKKSTTTSSNNNNYQQQNDGGETADDETASQQQSAPASAGVRKVENGRNIIDYMEGIMETGDSPSTSDQYDHQRNLKVQYDTEQQVKTYQVTKAHRRGDNGKKPPTITTTKIAPSTGGDNDMMTSDGHVTTVQVFPQVEGTPMELSRSTSLSNITIESDKFEFNNLTKTILLSGEVPAPVVVVVTSQRPAQIRPGGEMSSGKPPSGESKPPRSMDGRPRYPGYYQSLPSSDEIHSYNCEGSIGGSTTFSLPNNEAPSSGSHLVAPPPPQHVTSSSSRHQFDRLSTCKEADDEVVQEIRTPINDRVFNFQVEDTPMLFSDNSSLSSLEIDDAADMDLLNDCISSAMPVAKVDPNQVKPGTQYNPTPPPSNNRPQPQQQQAQQQAQTNVVEQQQLMPVDGLPSTSAADNRHYQQLQTSNLLNKSAVACNEDADLYELSSAKSDELGLGGCAQTLMRDQQKKQRDISRHKSANERRKVYRSAQGGTKSTSQCTSKEFSASSGSSNNIQPRNLRHDPGPCHRCAESKYYAANASTGHMTDNVAQAKTPRHRRRRRTASAAHHPRYPGGKYNYQQQQQPATTTAAYYQREVKSLRNGSSQGRHSNATGGYHHHHHHHGNACNGSSLVKIFPSLDHNGSLNGGGSHDDVIYTNEHDQYHHPLHHAPSSGGGGGQCSRVPNTPPPPPLSAPCRPSLVGKKAVTSQKMTSSGQQQPSKSQGKKKKSGGQGASGGSKEGLATSSGKNLWRGLKKMLSLNDGGEEKKTKKKVATSSGQETSDKKKQSSKSLHDLSSLSLSSSDGDDVITEEANDVIHHQSTSATICHSSSTTSYSRSPCCSAKQQRPHVAVVADVCPHVATCPLEGAATATGGRSRSTSNSSKFSHKSLTSSTRNHHHRKTSSSSRGGAHSSSRVSVRSHTSDDLSRDQVGGGQ